MYVSGGSVTVDASAISRSSAELVMAGGAVYIAEGDVTIKKEAIFEEGLQVGTGVTTTGHFSSGGDGFQCDSEARVINQIYADATSGASAATVEQCAEWAQIVLNSNGYYCNSKPLLTATDGENCPAGFNQATQVTGFTGYFTHESANGRCKLCTGDATKAGAGYHHYQYGTVTSGAVDFAKDGTLQTSGKATLNSMEVTNAGTVKDLTVSNTLVLDGTTTTTNGFTLTSEGDASINSVVVSTTLDVSGAIKLSGAQTSTALASFEAGLKTVGGSCNDDSKTKLQCAGDTCTVGGVAAQTCVWTPVDGVAALIDGSIEAKTVKLTDAAANALNVEKSNHCSNAAYDTQATCEAAGNVWTAVKNVVSISNDGTLTATKVESAGRIMPMYQETNDAGLHCSDNDGVIIQVVGACEAGLNYREWSCDDSGSDIPFSDFRNTVHGDNWMGSCSGTYTATYVADCSRYDGNGQPTDTNNHKFCEPLHTKAQCLGTELILRGKGYAVPDVEAAMAGVVEKVWTASGVVNMKVCVNGAVV